MDAFDAPRGRWGKKAKRTREKRREKERKYREFPEFRPVVPDAIWPWCFETTDVNHFQGWCAILEGYVIPSLSIFSYWKRRITSVCVCGSLYIPVCFSFLFSFFFFYFYFYFLATRIVKLYWREICCSNEKCEITWY